MGAGMWNGFQLHWRQEYSYNSPIAESETLERSRLPEADALLLAGHLRGHRNHLLDGRRKQSSRRSITQVAY